jgi:hypothetical protein
MRNSFCLIICVFLFSKCEDPIEVEVFDSEPLLVVEAQINWIKETQKTEQEVILSLSTSYFLDTYLPAVGAEVNIFDSNDNIYVFSEDTEAPGHYFPLDTIPYLLNQELKLNITYKGQEFTGTESLISVSTIDSISQKPIFFFGEERIQLDAFCIDPKNEKNYTFFEFSGESIEITEFNVYRDDFNDGFVYNGFLFGSDFEINDEIRFRQYGLSKRGFNYWNLLVNQNTQGRPFATVPVNLNGNIINLTNPNANPLGYFRASEVSEVIYLVK